MSRLIARYARDLAARAAKLELPQDLEQTFGRYRDHPVGFCRDVLGAESATRRSDGEPYQFTVLEDLVTYPRVAVRSGHGVGKTTIDAWAAIWWLTTRPMSRVIVLAPEFSRQIRAILFSEMRKWCRRADVLPLTVLANRVLVEGYGEEWSATGMSTGGDENRLEGFHADGGVLVIVDEMKGVPQDAFDAVQGALSGLEDSRLLVTSVPGGAGAGPFWKACQDQRRWTVHHLSSTDSSIVSPEWVEDRKLDWGVGSPLYQSRVAGEFSDAGEGVLFPLSLLEAATERELDQPEAVELALGVDVARSVAGDQNCIAQARGGKLESLTLWRSPDTIVTTQRVMNVATLSGTRPCIRVDAGGVGGPVADFLRKSGFRADDVHFGGASSDPQRFLNKRAEMFWNLRTRMEKGKVSLLADDELLADLSAIRYEFTARGQIKIEGKDECRKRLGRSPDRADAVALAIGAARRIYATVCRYWLTGNGGIIMRPDGGACSCFNCRHGSSGPCARDQSLRV